MSDSATPWTVVSQAPPSMGFSRQEYWSGLPFPSPGDLPNLEIEPRSPALQADALTSEPPGKPSQHIHGCKWTGFSTLNHDSSSFAQSPKRGQALAPTSSHFPCAVLKAPVCFTGGYHLLGLPRWLSGKESTCKCRWSWVLSLGQEDSLGKEMATHSSILTWRIPWTEGALQSMGSQKGRTQVSD